MMANKEKSFWMIILKVLCIVLCFGNINGQTSEWYGYLNLSRNIGRFNGINNEDSINKICIGYGWIIDTIGNITWINGGNNDIYTDSNTYGGIGSITSCFSISCINSVRIGLGKLFSRDVIAELIFNDDTDTRVGGTNPNDPPSEYYDFRCNNGECLSSLNVGYDLYVNALQFECTHIPTLQPTQYVYITIKCVYFYYNILGNITNVF